MPPARRDENDFYFEGFEAKPKFMIWPTAMVDVLMPRLSDAGFRVACYIARRTYGFDKTSDAISLKQMVEGIRRRDGTQLDYGTGLSKQGVLNGIKDCLTKGVITMHKTLSPSGDHEINVYALRSRASEAETGGVVNEVDYPRQPRGQGVVNEIDHRSQRTRHGVVNEVDLHDKSIQHEREQQQPPRLVASRPTQSGVVVASTRIDEQNEDEDHASLVSDLYALGVTKSVSRQLVRQYQAADIQEQIAALPFRTGAKEPAAVLVQAIKESWAIPKRLQDDRDKVEKARRSKADREAVEQAKAEAERARRDRSVKVQAYLATLSETERADLTDEARRRVHIEAGGSFWKERAIPRVILDAITRTIVAERMGLPPLEDNR